MGTDSLAVNSRDTFLPLARVGLYLSAGLLAGRKAVQGTAAGFFAISAKVADKLAIDREIIDEGSWRQWFHINRDRFIEMSKQNIHRDLSLAGILASGGLIIENLESLINFRLEQKNADASYFAKTMTGDYAGAAANTKKNISSIPSGITNLFSKSKESPEGFMDKIRRMRVTQLKHAKSPYCGPKCEKALERRIEILARLFSPITYCWKGTQNFFGNTLNPKILKGYNYGKGWAVWGVDGTAQISSVSWEFSKDWVPGLRPISEWTNVESRKFASGLYNVSEQGLSWSIHSLYSGGCSMWNGTMNKGSSLLSSGRGLTVVGGKVIDFSFKWMGKFSDLTWDLSEKVANKIEMKY